MTWPGGRIQIGLWKLDDFVDVQPSADRGLSKPVVKSGAAETSS